MSAKCQLSCSLLALAALYQLTLNVDSQLGCTQYARTQSVSSAHKQLLCDVSVQPYSVSTLVLQPGMQLEVLLLTVWHPVARHLRTLLYTLFLNDILSIRLGFARSNVSGITCAAENRTSNLLQCLSVVADMS